MKCINMPEWLLEKQEAFCPTVNELSVQNSPADLNNVRGKPRRRGFVEKTIDGIAHVLQEEFFAEQLAKRPGLLQGIDARIKVLTTLLL